MSRCRTSRPTPRRARAVRLHPNRPRLFLLTRAALSLRLSCSELRADRSLVVCADLWKRSDHIKKWNKRWFVLWPQTSRPGDGRVLFWFNAPVGPPPPPSARRAPPRIV